MQHPPSTRGRASRRRALLIGIAVTALALAGCAASPGGSDSTPGGAASGGSGTTISIQSPSLSASASQGALQYAIAKGYVSQYGIDLTTPLSSEGPLKAAVVSGNVTFDQLAGGDTLDLYAKGVGITAIACTATNTGYYLYAQQGVTTLAELQGKTVGVPSLGGAPQVALEAYLTGKGFAPDSVKFVALGSIPNVLTALTSGKIDSGLLSTPFNFKADAAGLPDIGYAEGPPTPFVVNTAWAQQHPQVVSDLLKGIIEGAWAYQTDEKDGIPVLAKFLGLDPDDPADQTTLQKSYAAYLPPVQAPPGRCSADDFSPYVQYQDASEQSALQNLTPLFDSSYIDALDQSGFYTQLQQQYGPIPGATVDQIVR